MGLYSWGCNTFGQLALEGGSNANVADDDIDDNNRTNPTKDMEGKCSTGQFSMSLKVWKLASGWLHTIIITEDKKTFSCGTNEHGQLGRTSHEFEIAPVSHLEQEEIVDASCGASHTLLLSAKGQVFAFGLNTCGQLGLGSDKASYAKPLLVERISINHEVTVISCGKEHSLALCSDGQLYAWGNNQFGQLGLGFKSLNASRPELVVSLHGCPITHISAGGYHSFVLTISGTIFAWGKNSNGQLGLGHINDKMYPTKVKFSLPQVQSVRYISCGEEHTVFLTSSGNIFTFGCGSSGQLGHNSFNDEHIPKMVIDFGATITSVACGRKHTLCYSLSSGSLYSFGLNVKGQLGIGSYQKQNSPMKIRQFWRNFTKTDFFNIPPEEKEEYFPELLSEFIDNLPQVSLTQQDISLNLRETLMGVAAGGLSSHLITCPIVEKPRLPMLNILTKKTCLRFLSQSMIEEMTEMWRKNYNSADRLKIKEHLAKAFSNQSTLNASFLSKKEHTSISKQAHGLHLMGIHVSLETLWQIGALRDIVKTCLSSSLLRSLHSDPADVECLRVYIIIPEALSLMSSDEMTPIGVSYAEGVVNLQIPARKILVSWWEKIPPTFLERIVKFLKSAILGLFPSERRLHFLETNLSSMNSCLKVLKLIHELNENRAETLVFTTFNIPGLMEKINIQRDFVGWIEDPDSFSFCHYPFVFEVKEKAILMEYDADIQMKYNRSLKIKTKLQKMAHLFAQLNLLWVRVLNNVGILQYMVSRAHMMNFNSLVSGQLDVPMNPYLVLNIRRDHLMQDTLNNILSQNILDFKKPLKVKFVDEMAEDAGGVKKEFFLLLMRDLLDPKYGMFDIFAETGYIWFKYGSFEAPEMYMLIGVLCGLAIYNSIIVDVSFPLCLYKKLLDRKVSLDDYRDLEPEVCRGLRAMLDYVQDDFSDVYDMNFQVMESVYGENQFIDLKDNGKDILVTQANKKEYVDLFLQHKLNNSVQHSFNSFKDGFLKVCGGKVLHFLHPQELMELVVGSQDYDFVELEKATEYKGEYYRSHPVIINFWEVFHSLSLDLKKKFLAFLTGTNKVSVLGMKYMKFIIQPVAGGEDGTHLPVAHTCFNLLDLPRYPDLETMRKKVLQAVENSEGFGII